MWLDGLNLTAVTLTIFMALLLLLCGIRFVVAMAVGFGVYEHSGERVLVPALLQHE